MIPSVTTPAQAPKPAATNAPPTANKTTAPPAPETARGSIGEMAAWNLKAETALAVDAPDQAAVAPRLRDQETSERTDRVQADRDSPTGPPPAFEESPLERQARVALDPPETPNTPDAPPDAELPETETARPDSNRQTDVNGDIDPPPTRRERAEVSFAVTRTLSEPREPAALDVSR